MGWDGLQWGVEVFGGWVGRYFGFIWSLTDLWLGWLVGRCSVCCAEAEQDIGHRFFVCNVILAHVWLSISPLLKKMLTKLKSDRLPRMRELSPDFAFPVLRFPNRARGALPLYFEVTRWQIEKHSRRTGASVTAVQRLTSVNNHGPPVTPFAPMRGYSHRCNVSGIGIEWVPNARIHKMPWVTC